MMNKALQKLIGWALVLASSAIGIYVAGFLVKGFTVRWTGLITATVVVTLSQMVLVPLVGKLLNKYVPLLAGGVGVISTVLGLFLASLLPNGISANSIGSWLVAGLVVWLVTGIASAVLVWLQTRQSTPAA